MYTTYLDADVATNGFLPSASVTPNWIGAYAASTYPNPLTTGSAAAVYAAGTDAANANVYLAVSTDAWAAGDVGLYDFYYYPASSIADTKGTVTDYVLQKQLSVYNSVVTTYATAKTGYDALKTSYNSALTTEETRVGDFFKAAFEPAVAIPTRPCPPE